MISHQFKCIYIHIPRTAGTSIEHAICGQDWWSIEPATKHLIASQARSLYKDYWDSYFKFSIVRDPFTRMLSALKYSAYFVDNLQAVKTYTDFLRGYMQKFGYPITVEHDHRFNTSVESTASLPNAVYLNMLDEELDYIGKFEELDVVFAKISQTLGLPSMSLAHHERSPSVLPNHVIGTEALRLLDQIFSKDLEYFDYQLPVSGSA